MAKLAAATAYDSNYGLWGWRTQRFMHCHSRGEQHNSNKYKYFCLTAVYLPSQMERIPQLCSVRDDIDIVKGSGRAVHPLPSLG